MNANLILAVAFAAPLMSACGGGDDKAPAALAATEPGLCPNSLDYSTVYTGGAGDGELVKLQLDTARMTWRISYIESPIPVTTGTVVPTRAGTVAAGTLTRETALPTHKLNNCAWRLNGASLDSTRPARVFVGFGVAGGTIPGAHLRYAGTSGVGAVPDTTFPYYPFIGFSVLETSLASVAGTYSQLGYGQVPSQNFAPTTIDGTVIIDADGTWQRCDTTGVRAGTCSQPGSNLTQAPDGSGAFVTNNYRSQVKPTSADKPQAKGYLIVGKLRNQLVPIMIRTGVGNPNPLPDASGIPALTADDESGISIMSPQNSVAAGSQNGEYIGVDDRFDYRATALVNNQATLLDPFNTSQVALATALNLDYTQTVPGTVTSTHVGASSTLTGKFIFAGGVFGFLDNSNITSPYFTIGAFVQ
ncbi:hypothetical protein BWP39_09830 [Paraburkholderia acidicola]|uniref:DUF2957 family protein n=1 Tax=Paraburkholderia acidicola TaxID=1912599 RepID=A0A2A4F3W2_9BURK|nr:DUF2957 domain-containing protein [Paraburkholderia acidicola]PCE27076.1 hypothetical protein BWP39_09830 [Paraburkholderia acidicola]